MENSPSRRVWLERRNAVFHEGDEGLCIDAKNNMMYTTAKHMSEVYSEVKFDVNNARNVRGRNVTLTVTLT